MKILFVEWESWGRKDLKEAFIAEGHELLIFPFQIVESRLHHDPETEGKLSASLKKEVPDLVFSVAYFAVISSVCQREKVRYISWTYDNPHVMLYSRTIVNSCNIAYVFDRELYRQFRQAGISTVRYLPMAANTDRLDGMAEDSYRYDVSFVGGLYLERNNYYDRMYGLLPDYARGYLDALIAAQLKVQGCYFIEDVLTPIIRELYRAIPMAVQPGGLETMEYLYANYIINRRVTAVERIDLLDAVARKHIVDLFTYFKDFSLPALRNHGPVDYNNEMPKVFRQSRINLNITLRGIQSGVPLRAFDIMGSGGFLLSNFQADFLEHFVPGEDFVYYESKEDLVQKVDYYLEHDKEREYIAGNGHDKVAAKHTYRHRVREMLEL